MQQRERLHDKRIQGLGRRLGDRFLRTGTRAERSSAHYCNKKAIIGKYRCISFNFEVEGEVKGHPQRAGMT